jgi:hypothetical protein
MTEITAENINKLITNDVAQFMKQVKAKKERSERQKENDAKLKDRLKLYHQQKKEAKEKQIIALRHLCDVENEIAKMKINSLAAEEDYLEIKEMLNPEKDHLEIKEMFNPEENTTKQLFEVIKAKKGRPKKLYPAAETSI